VAALAAAVTLALTVSACSRADADNEGSKPQPSSTGTSSAPLPTSAPAPELRLGYFPNVTHASAMIGVEKGFFADELGSTKLTTQTFNAGPDEMGALLGDSLDIAFIGPGPTINGFVQSDGDAIRLISGATSGGAQFVVRDGINSPADLAGTTIATPQLGNTQDVALKKWLAAEGIPVDSGDGVTVQNIANADGFTAFQQGDLDGGWLPEPWSSRYVIDGGAHVLINEADEWPGGRFPTTVMIVRTKYLEEYPSTVQAFLRGHIKAVEWAGENEDEAKTIVNGQLEELTGKALSDAVIDRAFENITLTFDPDAANFPQLAKDAVTAKVADSAPDLAGLADFAPLNAALAEVGLDAVDDAGLGSGS
jgi:NitT/TauT family transport system substrate-binding protein